jgi:hypothetical protein
MMAGHKRISRLVRTLAATAFGFAGDSDPIEFLLAAVKEYLLDFQFPRLSLRSLAPRTEGHHPHPSLASSELVLATIVTQGEK